MSSALIDNMSTSLPFFRATLSILPPSVNHMYQVVRYGPTRRLALTDEALQFKQDAALLLASADVYRDYATINAIRNAKIHVPLIVEMTFFFADLWKSDVDGRIKPVQDAVFKHLGLNDKLVLYVTAVKKEDKLEPRVEVAVRLALPDGEV